MSSAIAAATVVLLGAAGCRVLLVRAAARDVAGRLETRARMVRWPAPSRLRAALVDAAIPFDPDAVWSTWTVAGFTMVIVAGAFGGPGLAFVGVTAIVIGPAATLVALRGRSARQVDAALPDVLDGVARSLRSGAAMAQALDECREVATGRLSDDLTAVVESVANGASITSALDAWSARCPTPGVRLAVASVALAAESGGAAARAIGGVAETLRANLAVAAEVRAQAAQARLSALVIALSPLAFGALAAGTDRQTADFLFRTPIGVGCLVAGLLLDGAAAFWMHRITEVPA